MDLLFAKKNYGLFIATKTTQKLIKNGHHFHEIQQLLKGLEAVMIQNRNDKLSLKPSI